MNSELYSVLDQSADVLRSKMDASEYKSYLSDDRRDINDITRTKK